MSVPKVKRLRTARRARNGFSLTELLIVIGIILIILAISAPNLLRAREAANEASAAGALRTIAMGQVPYQMQYQGYAPDLKSLGPPKGGAKASATSADLIDEYLANGSRSGYRFRYTPVDLTGDGVLDGYFVNADPETRPDGRHFFVDQSAVIRSEAGRSADEKSKPGTMGGKEK